jgi:glycosyltransferase involved in cell wall biosynthesis
MQKRVSLIGNLGKADGCFNGQTVKTRIVTDELIRYFGSNQVDIYNTSAGLKVLFTAPLIAFKAVKRSDDIVVLPAQNAVRVFVPLLVLFNLFFKSKRIHYVVIGGWLPSFLKHKPLLSYFLKKVYMIYAETHHMQSALEAKGFVGNVTYMPNCKPLRIVDTDDFSDNFSQPYKICTFSRVWSQKGIAEAVDVVIKINQKYGRTVYHLDIYGQVEAGEEEWFANLQRKFPDYIKYGGLIAFDKSVDVLKSYFFLLFPTKCPGEGIPGTIIDAYAAGLPVVSSLYPNFAEIIEEGVTGLGYEFNNVGAFEKLLDKIACNPQIIINLKSNCVRRAKMFLPEEVLNILIKNIQ